MPITKLRFA